MKKRPAMIASVVRGVVARVLPQCPPTCGIVSLTEIEVSADFSYATCYVSALEHIEEAMSFLESQAKGLQSALGAELQMFRVPKIRFRVDERTQRGMRIDALLEGSE